MDLLSLNDLIRLAILDLEEVTETIIPLGHELPPNTLLFPFKIIPETCFQGFRILHRIQLEISKVTVSKARTIQS